MSVDYDDIVEKGYVRLKSRKLGTWQKKFVLLKRSSSQGMRRIEKFPSEDVANMGKPGKVIGLTSVKDVCQQYTDAKKNNVTIVFMDGSSRQLSFDTQNEADQWQQSIAYECFKRDQGFVAANNNSPTLGGLQLADYFHVYLLPNPRTEVQGECIMQITGELLSLLDIDSKAELLSWPLSSLRKYGWDENKFSFESGRSCKTGPAVFTLNTTQGSIVYDKVHNATLAIAEAHRIVSRQNLAMNGRVPVGPCKSLPSVPDRDVPPVRGRASLPSSPVTGTGPPPIPPRVDHNASLGRRPPLPSEPPPEDGEGPYLGPSNPSGQPQSEHGDSDEEDKEFPPSTDTES